MSTARLILASDVAPIRGTVKSILDYGVKGDTLSLSDGSITSGQAAFNSPAATFTAADVGKSILILGAGAAGVPLSTTIIAAPTAHQVTLAANASTTIASGGRYVYGTDDTAAIATAVATVSGKGSELFVPSGAYWLASQTVAMALSKMSLQGVGPCAAALPYTDQGSVFVITGTSASPFSVGAGVTIQGMTFFWPAQDGSSATPTTYPALMTGSAISNFTFESNYVINAYKLLATTDAGGSSIGRAFFRSNRIYAVDTVFDFANGAADIISIDSTNYFGFGVYQDVAIVGNQYLAKYTNTSGVIYKINVGSASKTSIDGLAIKGAFHYGYRYGIRLLSGLLNNSAINADWDAIPTILSQEGTSKLDGVSFAGWVYSLQSYGSSPAAAAFDAFAFASSAATGKVTMSGLHIAYAQGNAINISAAAFEEIDISGMTIGAWGQSTTNSTYYGVLVNGAVGVNVSGNVIKGNAVSGSFQVGIGIASKSMANISGCKFANCYYPVQDTSSSNITNLVGNVTANSASSTAVNNGVSGTATIYGIGNRWDKAPNVALSNGA